MKNYVINLLIEKLEDYEDTKGYACDLTYILLEEYYVNCTITYNTYKAKEWLKENFEEIGDFLEDYKLNFGNEHLSQLALDIFNSPQKAMVIICLEKANEILSSLDFIQANWDKEIVLNDKNINIIKKELKEYEN